MNYSIKNMSKHCVPEKKCHSIKMLMITYLISVAFYAVCTLIRFLLKSNAVSSAFSGLGVYALPVSRIVLCCLGFFITVMLRSSLRMGREAWFLSIAKNKKPKKARVTFWCNPRRSMYLVKVYAVLFVLKFLWAVIFFFPGITVIVCTVYTVISRGLEYRVLISMLSGGAALLATGVIFWSVCVQRYLLVTAYIADNPDEKLKCAIRKSIAATKNKRAGSFWLKLSFLPWFMSCVLIFPLLYVVPYYNRSVLCMKRVLMLSAMKKDDSQAQMI